MEAPTPELLDSQIDSSHRSYRCAVLREQLSVLHTRPSRETLYVDARWAGRLREAGLLTLGRLVEDRVPKLDKSLLSALVDRWRPETHTFHLPCGEMAPTLQDIAYLLGLPIVGPAVGPRVVPSGWRDDLEARFAAVQRMDGLDEVQPHPQTSGPAKIWLLQFQANYLAVDADEYSVTRSFEVYLLWLFGYIMFNNTRGNCVDRVLSVYAQEITDAIEGEVPVYAWGSAVLASTYRGLCDACQKNEANAILSGCPIFLQLWSYERIAIGRPLIDQSSYDAVFYGAFAEDGPTMGSFWYRRQPTWAHNQVRRAYPEFVAEFDRLTSEDVVWEPYSTEAVASRAPLGLSPLCTASKAIWMATTILVYDVAVEAHCPDRVMRQFGRRQPFPLPSSLDRVPRQDHRLNRLGVPCSGIWVTKVQQWVDAWEAAADHMFEPTGPHTEASFRAYLTWYMPRTRYRLTYADTSQQPHIASSTDGYARHRDEALAGAFNMLKLLETDASTYVMRLDGGTGMTHYEQRQAWVRTRDGLRKALHAYGNRAQETPDVAQETPEPTGRTESAARSPDHHTYSVDHVTMQHRAKRSRCPRGG